MATIQKLVEKKATIMFVTFILENYFTLYFYFV